MLTATNAEPGTFIKVRGKANLSYDALCDLGGCEECTGSVAFVEFGHSVVLQPNTQTYGPDDVWQCRSSLCAEATVCEPIDADGEYWAWGTAQAHSTEDPAGTDVRLVVDGWCAVPQP